MIERECEREIGENKKRTIERKKESENVYRRVRGRECVREEGRGRERDRDIGWRARCCILFAVF